MTSFQTQSLPEFVPHPGFSVSWIHAALGPLVVPLLNLDVCFALSPPVEIHEGSVPSSSMCQVWWFYFFGG